MKKLTQLIYIAYSLLYSGSLSTGAESGATNSVSITINPAVSVYRLHPGDTIEVHIYGEDDLTSKAKLNENGEVILPLLPALDLNGNTLEQANERIGSAYKKNYLRNPVVTVSIIEYGNSKVSVLGQVSRPGIYQFPSNERLNLLQAIALAGGYTRIGEPSRVTIKRMVDGHTTIIRLDAAAMAEKEKTTILEVKPDDVINVGETIF